MLSEAKNLAPRIAERATEILRFAQNDPQKTRECFVADPKERGKNNFRNYPRPSGEREG
jgi:hypothetical protein